MTPAGCAALPPGPELPELAQTVAFHRDPLGVLRRARARHGPVFTLRLAVAGPMVAVAAPEAVGALVRADPDRAHAGEGRRRILPMASPRSVFGADGERHRVARAAIEPAFTPEATAARRPAIAGLAEMRARDWPDGRPFRVLSRMRALLDEIFVRLVLGVSDERRGEQLTSAIHRMLWTPGNPPLSVPGERNGLAGAAATALFKRRHAPVARLLGEEISARRRAGAEGDDVVSCAVRAEPAECDDVLAADLTAVLMAAQEPPAAALTWLLLRVGEDPRLAELVEAGDERSAGVVRETLRLRPAAFASIRRLTAPFEAAGHELGPGTVAMVPIPLIHREPRAFPRPDSFLPERWADSNAGAALYMPFGGGTRRCLGEHLAHAYIDVVLPAVLRAAKLRPAWPHPERMVLRGTILLPHRGGLMVSGG